MDMERDNQVIYFKDLIFVALYRWRWLIAAALVLALALGGVTGVSILRSRSAQTEQTVVQENSDSPALKELETAQQALEQQQIYNRDSMLMQIDPHNVHTVTLVLAVATDYQLRPNEVFQDPDPAETLLRGYQAQFSTGAVSEALEIEDKYLQEMMLFELTPTARTLQLQVSCNNEEIAQKLLQVLTDNLTAIQAKVTEAVCDHQLMVLASDVAVRVDAELAKKQLEAVERTRILEDNLAEARAAVPSGVTGGTSLKKAVILAVLGAIAGAGLVACVVWVRHMGGDRVYSQRVLQNRTGVKVLGCAPGVKKKCAVDLWLRKLEGRNVSSDQLDVLAADIANRCGGKPLLVTGEASGADREALVKALVQAGVNAQDRGSILASAQCMKALPEYDFVLLAEQCEISRYGQVSRAVELMTDHNKQLLGCVLLDG